MPCSSCWSGTDRPPRPSSRTGPLIYLLVDDMAGRACLAFDHGVVDVERASAGTFGPDVHSLLGNWQAFLAWAEERRRGRWAR